MNKFFLLGLGYFIITGLATFFLNKIVDQSGIMTLPIWVVAAGIILVVGLLLLVIWFQTEDGKEKSIPSDAVPRKNQRSKRGIKSIQDEMEFKKIETDNFITTISIQRCFYPDQNPGVEEFLRALIIHKPICLCGNSFNFRRLRDGGVFSCLNKDGHEETPFAYVFSNIEIELRVILNNFKGEIRRDGYNESWNKYEKWYNKMTKGMVDDYFPPLGKPSRRHQIDLEE